MSLRHLYKRYGGDNWNTFLQGLCPLVDSTKLRVLLDGPNITVNLYCICLSEHETGDYTDAVKICGNI